MTYLRSILLTVITVLSLLLLTACVTTEDRQKRAAEDRVSYRVKSGDSLYSISWRFGLDARQVARWNRLKHPYPIFPGQLVFLSPEIKYKHPATNKTSVAKRYSKKPALRPAKPKIKPKATVKPPKASTQKRLSTKPQTAAVEIHKPEKIKPLAAKKVYWQWPLRVNKRSKSRITRSSDGLGIQLKGKAGQTVFAAAEGKVVYSGNNLKGYGELIIIKHDNELISAYAHNRKRFAPEGLWVKKGQKIAELGTRAGEQEASLYFDIRQFGKSVDPMQYLPVL